MTSRCDNAFLFERLDAYRVALSIARWVRTTAWPRGTTHLKDQATRAAESMVLNIAEGSSRGGRPGLNHWRIAQGSAGEVFAVLDLLELDSDGEQRKRLRRVGEMLTGLLRSPARK